MSHGAFVGLTTSETGFLLLAAAVAALLVLPYAFGALMRYVVLPLRAWGEPMPADPPLLPIDPQRVPKAVSAFAERAARQLAELGFDKAADLYGPESLPRIDGYLAIWLKPCDGVSSHVITAHVRRADFETFNSVIGFVTEFTDGTAVITGNSGESSFSPDPRCDGVRWPGMRDAAVLYRLHSARVLALRGERQTFLPPADGVVGYARALHVKTLQGQADAGYLRFHAADGTFTKTLKGSFMMLWRLQWPLRQIVARRHEAKLRRALAEAGMGRPEDYPPRPASDRAEIPLAYESDER